jgi:hypothetical protein
VNINDPIEMYLINHDAVNNHSIAAVMHIERDDEIKTKGGEPW